MRLLQGDMARGDGFLGTIPRRRHGHSRRPAFAWLHVVDLNGAFAGKPVNDDAVGAILEAVDIRFSSAAASGTWLRSKHGSAAA